MTTVYLSPIGNGAQFFDANGNPLAGGQLFSYVAGSSTPQATYTTNAGNVANANPIVLSADGRPPQEIWLTSASYKFVLQDANSVIVPGATYDNIMGIASPSSTLNPGVSEWGGTATGTANALAITTTPPISIYVIGQKFRFKAGASSNTAATTINVDGIGNISVQVGGVGCTGGEIIANQFYEVLIDSLSTCQLTPVDAMPAYSPTLTLASAGTVNIGGAGSENIIISGAVTVTAFDTVAEGITRVVTYSGAVPITYNGTSMQLIGGASRTYAVGDSSVFKSLGGGNWKELFYQPATPSKAIFSITAVANTPTNGLTITATAGQVIDFRSATLGSGTVNTRYVPSAISTVISSGSTGGTTSAVLGRIYVAGIDNAGTVELAWINAIGATALDEDELISTTAEGGAGTANTAGTWYSTTARASVPFRILGFFEFTEATAGTWVTQPSTIQGAGGESMANVHGIGNGQTWQSVTRTSGVTYCNTTGRPIFLTANSSSGGSGSTTITVDGLTIQNFGANATAALTSGSVLIPQNSCYVITDTGTSTHTAFELR